jgi:PTH1 family peptidyl-tRNA hydrolase
MHMKLIIGLGNIGQQYQLTRHNIGFFVVDHIARQFDATFVEKTKFKCDMAEFTFNGEKALLIKPMTYYNESGAAVRAVMDFYKIDTADILAVHDELALPFGTVRARLGGSDAGNNGIKSVTAHVGDQYGRIRVGIKNDHHSQMQDADFVLSKFNKDEQVQLPLLAEHAQVIIEAFLQDTFEPHTVSVSA